MASWPGERRAIVSISYDGTHRSHLERVLPFLYAYDLRATFYAYPSRLLQQVQAWVEASAHHEIGNGCLIGAALEDGGLPLWTRSAIHDEIAESERLLDELIGAGVERSFGYPKGKPTCALGENYRSVVSSMFRVARSGEAGANLASKFDPQYLRMNSCREKNGLVLRHEVLSRLNNHEWVILAFDDALNSMREWETHCFLLSWLADQRSSLAIAPVVDVARWLRYRTSET